MADELSCKKQQSCFAKIYLRMLQAILQYCNGQKYNANETRISGQIKFTYAKIGFCFKNCSGPLREKIVLAIEKNFCKFEAEGREFSNILRSLKQFIQTVKRSEQFLKQSSFLTSILTTTAL